MLRLAVGVVLAGVSIVVADSAPELEIPGPRVGRVQLLANKPQYPVVFRAKDVSLMVSLEYCLEWQKWHMPPFEDPVLEHYRVVRTLLPPSTVIELPQSKANGCRMFTDLVLDALRDQQVYCTENQSGPTI